jgi:hypothetical protein
MGNNRKVLGLVVALLLVVGGGALILRRSREPGAAFTPPPHPPPPTTSPHAAEIDRSMGSILALYHAPAASTPCETAYNAFYASQEYAARENATAAVLRLAPRDDFLQRCNALPAASQQCMVPLYLTQHKDECEGLKPSDDVMAAMVELKKRTTGPPPGAVPQPGAAGP